jgi:UDP-N-acetylmuramyl pentapeptide phosphotransferase/UDP-N-acetylglucosamine-1-phosphate transferase
MEFDAASWQVVLPAGLALLFGTMATTAALIALLFPLLRRYALARPNARSSHKIPTPQGGGIAVTASTLAGLLGASVWVDRGGLVGEPHLFAVLAATAGLAALGMVDDIRPLPAAPRLALQTIAVGLVVATLPADLRILPAAPVLFERAALAFALLWFVNLVNFMDGLDWMSVAETVPVTAALAVLAAVGAAPPLAGLAALALCGAMLGFAPFNRPVARLFLGDVGSLPLGLVMGWLLALLAGRGHLAAALLLPLYYLADATITLLRRLAKGERLWEAHRTHFYQRAIANGFTASQVTARVFALNVALAALAVVTVLAPGLLVEAIALALGTALVLATLVQWSRPRHTDRSSLEAP